MKELTLYFLTYGVKEGRRRRVGGVQVRDPTLFFVL